MNKILIASNNPHKISEISDILKRVKELKLFSLRDLGISIEVIEDGSTLEENALIKAKQNYKILKIPVISDDTGLFVDGLNGDPGVFSSRYAGDNASYEDNCKKLLNNMNKIPDKKRTAGFESVICFYVNDSEYYMFNGGCKGVIIKEGRGDNGFGYDPLFVPDGFSKTFAELTDKEKNNISHRALALENFKSFIDSYLK